MEKLTMEALKASIKSWEGKVSLLKRGEMPPIGGDSCPLCVRFNEFGGCSHRGEDCPVAASTGEVMCHGTPYYRVSAAVDRGDLAEALKWAKKMLKFLKGLMPTQEG